MHSGSGDSPGRVKSMTSNIEKEMEASEYSNSISKSLPSKNLQMHAVFDRIKDNKHLSAT